MRPQSLSRVSLRPHDFSPPGSSVHGIFQTSTLEGVAISSSREPSRMKDESPALAGRFFTTEPPGRGA